MPEPQAKASPLRMLTAQMRAAASRNETPAEAFLKQAVAFLRAEKNEIDRARLSSELAFTLADVLDASRDRAVVKFALQAMLDQGAPGELAAFSYLGKNSETPEEMARVLDVLPPRRQLALLNRFFMVPRAVDPRVMESAVERVKEIAGQEPEEVLLFLERLGEQGREPAYALQWEILRGQFGVWLDQLLKLELSREQIDYMVRTAGLLESPALASTLAGLTTGSQGPSAVLAMRAAARAGAVNPGEPEKIARQGLKHADPQVRREALAALIALGSEAAPKALALLLAKRPEDRAALLPLALSLWSRDFHVLAGHLPDGQRAEILWELSCLVAVGDNAGLARVASGMAGSRDKATALAARALHKLAGHHEDASPKAAFAPRPYVRKVPKKEDHDGMLGKLKRRVEEMAGKEEAEHHGGAQALASLEVGGKLGRISVQNAELPGIELRNCVFENTSFTSLGLQDSLFAQCRFKSCRFKFVDFSGAKLDAPIIHGAVFERCVFTDASIEDAFFSGCTFKGCHFGAASLGGLQAEDCLFVGCDFWGAQIIGASLSSCAFSVSNFGWARFTDSILQGVSWRDCDFERTFFERAGFPACSSVAGRFAGSRFLEVGASDPEFLQACRTALQGSVNGPKPRHPAPPTGIFDPQVAQGMVRVLDGWYFERDCLRREEAVSAHNRRRLLWAAGKWGARPAEFLKLLPFLIETDKAVPGAGSQAPACRLAGYHPDHATLRLVEKYLGKEAAEKHEPGDAPLLEGLYSMGSVGTIAQTLDSDLDMWLCHEPGVLQGGALEAVRDKLADIEAWADKEFGLEVHFFLMDMQSVRDNDFGFSDKESAGSAQAKLLKEEFYRTVVHLAGKKPAWWLVPEGATSHEYRATLERLAGNTCLGPDALADLGHLEAVPKEEFFGASLWQIVKALKRPFKSVMKFALLERYFATEENGLLFCDGIKARLFKGVRDLWEVDGYGVLFREVYDYYTRTGNEEAKDLMRRAFLQKTRFNLEGRTTGRPADMTGASFMEYFHPVSESPLEREIAPAVSPGKAAEGAGFSQMVGTGRRIGKFIFSTYESVQNALSSESRRAQVSKEDMTKLGRKIFANFSHKEGKVMLVPFVAAPRGLYSSLDIQCMGAPGAQSLWVARGRRAGVGDEGKSAVDEIVKEHHPVSLMAWLVANRIYDPKLSIQGGNLQKPLSLPDLTEIMAAMHAFFPHEDTFNTDIEENLNEERAVKVFTVVNLMSLREEITIRDAQLVYATNWGEMFFLPNPGGLHLLESDPLNFVRSNVPHARGYNIQTEFHIPHKARCPRILLP